MNAAAINSPYVADAMTTQQYHLTASDGRTWKDIDPGNLTVMLVGLVAFWLEGRSNADGVVEGGPDDSAYLRQAIALVERGLSPR